MQLPKHGTKVRIKDKIESPEYCEAFNVAQRFIDRRKPGATGTYTGWVPGCGGDVWWVEHAKDWHAAYLYTEVEILTEELQRTSEGDGNG